MLEDIHFVGLHGNRFQIKLKHLNLNLNPDDVLELQEDLNRLVDWANTWQMNFNVDKCVVMRICHNI